MAGMGRNFPCPCGSGSKYKRCCLGREEAVARDTKRAESLWARMQRWAFDSYGDELTVALGDHLAARKVGTEERPAEDDDLALAIGWLLIDRELDAGGGKPARLYAELPGLDESDRALARRIADCALGIHRVTDVYPGKWIELENVLDASTAKVVSSNVSLEAVRWHVLVCRVMTGGPGPTIWGAAAFYLPLEESEVLDELRRVARERGLGTSTEALERALQVGAGELVRFVPPSRSAEVTVHTLEGDPAVVAEATWTVTDPVCASRRLHDVAELVDGGPTDDGEGFIFDWLTSRTGLLACRGELPPGALCIEGGPVPLDDRSFGTDDVTSLGTFTLSGDHLDFVGMSERRLDAAVALVDGHLGDLAGDPTRRVRSLDDVRSSGASEPGDLSRARRSAAHQTGEERSQTATEAALSVVYRRWLDDPNRLLGGLTPREAAARGEYGNEIELLLRSLENRSAYGRTDRHPGSEVARLRAELSSAPVGRSTTTAS
jgi:hypothetical protein